MEVGVWKEEWVTHTFFLAQGQLAQLEPETLCACFPSHPLSDFQLGPAIARPGLGELQTQARDARLRLGPLPQLP